MEERVRVTLDEIASTFSFEVDSVGGELERTVTEEGQLYIFAHLPHIDEAAPHDFIGGGLAMRASQTAIGIHPYLVRQACINGFVMARVLQEPPILLQELSTPDRLNFAIGQAVRMASSGDVFDFAMDRMRAAGQVPAFSGNFSIDLSLLLNRPFAREYLDRIMQRVSQENDDSAFGLANGVTSVARDLVHPEDRWQLEVLGGEIVVLAGRSVALPRSRPHGAELAAAHA